MLPPAPSDKTATRSQLDVLIRAGLISVLAFFCFQVFQPFLNLMLWSIILAITLYPLQGMLKNRLGIRDGLAASLIILVAIILLLVPAYLMGASITSSVEGAVTLFRSGDVRIPPPNDSIATWPLIGQNLYDFWQHASDDLTSLLRKVMPYVRSGGLRLLSRMAGVGLGFLMFIAALIIAGIFMAYGENGSRSSVMIASRISGPDKGPQIAALCTATVRAVAQGVVGIAFIQMLLVGAGFVVKGVPGAGFLALVVLLVSIVQLPSLVIIVPIIGVVFALEGTNAATIAFAIYSLVACQTDNVLKPLLLGRGVNVPMPIVLIGALGGMVTGGIIGLFTGSVVLAVGYELFWQWVEDSQPNSEPDEKPNG
ncbi:AI-2E family transporter [Pseudomonas sp. 6D_7.1_Bac1]|uniref:AI-2E family transporter n=1 Tax=Pseudomonas sp. 6D_7.1_Bac1 TaxID=2971615 RepID=UPI0021C606D4|nr:AI-2E family transporter [Pseudomonas sp. 6D_7.1_Bac1]MCU1752772.1 AI-2E family transporter [Pseudomonas sp. 6D_7.1_Bac1]